MLASMASEEHGDETGLQCEEALPAEDHAGKSVAGSPSVPSSQARVPEQHLGWKVGDCQSCVVRLLCSNAPKLSGLECPPRVALALFNSCKQRGLHYSRVVTE